MMTRVITPARALWPLPVLLLLLMVSARADDPYQLIRRGQLAEAADSLARQTSAATRDGNLLFCQGLLAKDGPESSRLLQAALDAGALPRYQEEIYLRQAQYALLGRDWGTLVRIVSAYVTSFPVGRFRPTMLRYAIVVSEESGDFDAALREIDRYLLAYQEGEDRQWGLIDKARIMRANGKGIGNVSTLRKLSHERSGPGVPLALYALTVSAVDDKQTDDAVLSYNLLREAYPSAIGLDLLEEQIGKLPPAPAKAAKAEKVTGTYYSVKAGVFSSAENARSFADRLRKFDPEVAVVTKSVSGKVYQIVYVGRFSSYDAAGALKAKLEKELKEACQVVAR